MQRIFGKITASQSGEKSITHTAHLRLCYLHIWSKH